MSRVYNKKKLPKNIKGLSPEELLEILKKKKECNTRALEIVERLSDDQVDVDWMMDNLFFINQDHYDDVTIERSISKTCGYPACKARLGDIPKQQFRISLASNTVFDITERKKFCSSKCFKASCFLKAQLLTSPLWFRDTEVKPIFKLMTEESSKLSSSPCQNHMDTPSTENICPKIFIPSSTEKIAAAISTNNDINNETTENNFEFTSNQTKMESFPERLISRNSESNKLFVDKPTKKNKADLGAQVIKNVPTENLTRNDEKVPQLDTVRRIEKCLEEWFTISSYIHLLGEEKLKEEFEDKNILKRLKLSQSTSMDQKRFEDISRLFSILKLDGDDDVKVELKPLPDYSTLKAETVNLNIKVRAFYTGQLEVPPAPSTSTDDNDTSLPGAMPLVDSHAQTALRRRLFLDRLNRVIPDMCLSLGLSGHVVTSDIRSLVHTFRLSPHNITFQPREWFLISVIFIKMLSLMNRLLASNLLEEDTKKKTTLLLMSFNLGCDYLDNLMEWLTNTERLTALIEN